MYIFKKFLIWLSIILVTLILLFFIGTSLLINSYQPDFEKAFSENIGLQTKIKGKIQLKVIPGFSFVINQLDLISNETYVFRAKKVEISLDFKQLLTNQKISIIAVQLFDPQVFIARNSDGSLNFDNINKDSKIQLKLYPFNLEKLIVDGGSLLYIDKENKDTLLIDGLNLSTNTINAEGNATTFSMKNIQVSGNLSFEKLQLNALGLKNLTFRFDGDGGKIIILPDTGSFYGGKLSGKSIIDFTQITVMTQIDYMAEQFSIDSLLIDFNTPYFLKGKMDYQVSVKFTSFDWKKAMENLEGFMILKGNKVTLYGFESATAIELFLKTKEFSAINAGAALMAGPVGAVFTKDRSLSALLTYESGDSLLADEFISKWGFTDGKISAEDVAFSQSDFRMAINGKIDYRNHFYHSLTISLLNKEGCAILSQQLEGDFEQPEIKTIAALDSKDKNLAEFWREANSSSTRNCAFVYQGAINSLNY